MAVAQDGAWRKDGCGTGDSDQHNHGRGDGNGRCRVHNDAQRAVVRIALERMVVGHLGHGQQRQQDQAQQGSDPESVLLGCTLPAILSKSHPLYEALYQGYTELDAKGRTGVTLRAGFGLLPSCQPCPRRLV